MRSGVLFLSNRSLGGEELAGVKQNRIVNTTILVQGNATIVIPVSCVEHGRWSYDSPRFRSKERMMSSNLRAMKSEQVNYSIRSSKNSLKATPWMPSTGMTRTKNKRLSKVKSPNSGKRPFQSISKGALLWVWVQTPVWNPEK